MHFVKLGNCGGCHVWFCSTTPDGNDYHHLYFTVSVYAMMQQHSSYIYSYHVNCYSARFLTLLSKRKTVDGIWFLMLIAYVYTADTCLNLLRCVQVYENEPDNFTGKRVSNHTSVGV